MTKKELVDRISEELGVKRVIVTDLAAAAVAVQLVGTDIGSPNATGKAYKSLRATRMERDMVKKLNRAAGRLHRL